MMISSFDIFDTCLLRKCGTPENFFDVFSLRAFTSEVSDRERQEFVAARIYTQRSIQSPSMTLHDIWNAFSWTHPLLKKKEELFQLEQETEREMLEPVLSMRDKVNEFRAKGHRIIFISDMYLSSDFLRDVMKETGFLQDGDGLYVSCEEDAMKNTGDLFRYVKEKERLSTYRNWHHYGDNRIGDYKAPRKLGIRATLVNHEYTYYQNQWIKQACTTGYPSISILVGLNRSLRYSLITNEHTDFVLDMIAPLYCSLVYRMMRDAENKGISRLYFCARDAYMMYIIAQKYAPMFPTIENKFLYISKKALYEGNDFAKETYYLQEGLATKREKVAIVDFRSSGKTLLFLNNWLTQRGYNSVRGYYYEMFNMRDIEYFGTDYYCEVNSTYSLNKNDLGRLLAHPSVMEQFFPLNTLQRTVDYMVDESGKAIPVFDADEKQTSENEKFRLTEMFKWAEYHKTIIEHYADEYKQLLAKYSDAVFMCILLTMVEFFTYPCIDYLKPLQQFYITKWNGNGYDWVPYVKKCTLLHLVLHRGRDTAWRRATLLYSTPKLIRKIIVMRKKNDL